MTNLNPGLPLGEIHKRIEDAQRTLDIVSQALSLGDTPTLESLLIRARLDLDDVRATIYYMIDKDDRPI